MRHLQAMGKDVRRLGAAHGKLAAGNQTFPAAPALHPPVTGPWRPVCARSWRAGRTL